MRQEIGKCSISYEPCDDNSFGIGPTHSNGMPGGSMTGTGGMGTGGSILSDPGQAGLLSNCFILFAFHLNIEFYFEYVHSIIYVHHFDPIEKSFNIFAKHHDDS